MRLRRADPRNQAPDRARADGKITPELIASRLAGRGDEHFAQPGVVAITQSTEFGTCYSLDELRAIKDFCAANELRVFLDGARLANAAAYLGCTLADIAAHADVLSFGGTKNGAMGVEAVIVMQAADAANAPYLRKQHMQLSSKMRFLAAQFNALLADDLWLANAAHANAMAARLASGLAHPRRRRRLSRPGGRGVRPPGSRPHRRAAA